MLVAYLNPVDMCKFVVNNKLINSLNKYFNVPKLPLLHT